LPALHETANRPLVGNKKSVRYEAFANGSGSANTAINRAKPAEHCTLHRVTPAAFERSAVDILFSLPLYRTTMIWRDEYVRKSDLN
jgi:hypothetical protein